MDNDQQQQQKDDDSSLEFVDDMDVDNKNNSDIEDMEVDNFGDKNNFDADADEDYFNFFEYEDFCVSPPQNSNESIENKEDRAEGHVTHKRAEASVESEHEETDNETSDSSENFGSDDELSEDEESTDDDDVYLPSDGNYNTLIQFILKIL